MKLAKGPVNLVDPSIKHHHFAVQIGGRAKTKIATLQDRFDADLSVIHTFNECAGNRDLKQRVCGYAEIF